MRNLNDLKRAAEREQMRDVPHFGARSEQKILKAITFYEEASGRRLLGQVLEPAPRMEAALTKVPGVVRAVVAGSIRRRRETIGDIDLLVAGDQPARVSRAFAELPEVDSVLAQGPTKTLVRLSSGMDADLRVVEVDAQPERLDLSDVLVRRALDAGARIAVDSDAHTPDELRFVDTFGVSVARRGWATAARVINSLPVDQMLRALKAGRRGPAAAARA